MRAHPSPARIWVALAVVYVVWGSTYLFILLAERTLPVFVMSSLRFLIAGGLLYVWAIRRGDRVGDRPGWRQWVAASLVGGALFVAGGLVPTALLVAYFAAEGALELAWWGFVRVNVGYVSQPSILDIWRLLVDDTVTFAEMTSQ